ncbi:CAP domain-containing protein [Alkalibacterium indicireducens]|uniref:SCP domain-containing protein n=1 Tax=Alkalibacterium indicireducens TaxID=398758 RepID=A0ABP3KMF6_9LACT
MTFIRKLLVLTITLIVGFWLGTSGILNGTTVGNWMNTIVSYLPSSGDFDRLDLSFDQTPFINNSFTLPSSSSNDEELEAPSVSSDQADDIDVDLIENTIIRLVNELRDEQGVGTLTSNDMLRSAATIRAIETEELFSHTRPDGSDAFAVFDEEGIHYPYRVAGENLGMATHYLSDEEMAELIFNGWVESEGHYENMIRPDFEEIGVGVHYDGEYLYATQLFGTQR